jgi:hypothetical protein
LDAFVGGGGVCQGISGTPRISFPHSSEHEIATAFFICVDGFVSGQDIDIQVRLPNGSVTKIGSANLTASNGTSAGGAELVWTSLPGDPLGEHTIIAVQGERHATATFAISPTSEPRYAVIPHVGSPGTTFQIRLLGFRPSQNVQMHLYRLQGRVWRYITSLPRPLGDVQVGEHGEMTYDLVTLTDDPAGSYKLVLIPAAKSPTDTDFVLR